MRWFVAVLLAGSLAACAFGRVGFDARADAEAPLGPFGAPTRLTALNSNADEDDAALTGDMLEIYFDSTRAGGLGGEDIYCSKRPSIDAPWPPPAHVLELSTPGSDLGPGISPDGLTMYLSRGAASNGQEIHVATRPHPTEPARGAHHSASWSSGRQPRRPTRSRRRMGAKPAGRSPSIRRMARRRGSSAG